MSSIDNSSRKAQQSELNDLQAEYARKRKELVQKNEQELNSLKDYYGSKKDSLITEGEAAINHIRQRQQEQIEATAQERERINQNYRNSSQALTSSYNERLQSTRNKNEQNLEEVKNYGQQRVKQAQADSEYRLEQVNAKGSNDLAAAKQHHSSQLHTATSLNEKRLQNLKEQNALASKTEIERGRLTQAKLKEEIQEEFDKTWVRGEDKIEQAEKTQAGKLERFNENIEKRYDQAQNYWEAKEEALIDQYSKRLEKQKVTNENQIRNQNERFKSTYQKNELAQQESLNIQKQNFTRSLAETKKDFAKAAAKYSDRKDDPFYKVEDRGSELRENPDYYFFKAYIPEHEKDTVRVSVQENKVTVSGQRSFKDKVEGDNKSISTSNYQTFREEFALETPVNTKEMKRERDGDWVTFTLPKGMATRLNRKA